MEVCCRLEDGTVDVAVNSRGWLEAAVNAEVKRINIYGKVLYKFFKSLQEMESQTESGRSGQLTFLSCHLASIKPLHSPAIDTKGFFSLGA